MAVSKETIAWLDDLFAPIDGVSIKRMFGGAGIFRQGLMFALVPEEGGVAFKADKENAPHFAAEGCREWVYEGKRGPDGKPRPMRMGYWHAPERLYDEPKAIGQWALAAFEAAKRADAAKPPARRKWKP